MFERVFYLKSAVALYQTKPTGKAFSFSADDWELIEDVVGLLRPAYLATKEMSSERYVSGSKVIPLTKGLFATYHKREAMYGDAPPDSFKSRSVPRAVT